MGGPHVVYVGAKVKSKNLHEHMIKVHPRHMRSIDYSISLKSMLGICLLYVESVIYLHS